MKEFLHEIWRIFFPTECISCHHPLHYREKLLCANCVKTFELVDPSSRCPRCFSDEIQRPHAFCHECSQNDFLPDYMAAAFDSSSSINQVLYEFKHNDRPYLARSLASFLYLQFDRLKWTLPDLITFIPLPRLKQYARGYNQGYLLAKELSQIIQKPVLGTLKINTPTISQSQLVLKDRKRLTCDKFSVMNASSLEDKVILVLDDLFVTRATLKSATCALRHAHPQRIYALTLLQG